MKPTSLHRQLLRIVRYFLCSALFLLLFVLFLSNTIFSNLNTLLRQQSLYSNYPALAEDLQSHITDFLYQPENFLAEDLIEQAHSLSEMSSEITEAFWDAQFLDHRFINDAYVAAVCDFLTSSFSSRQELLRSYQTTQRLYEHTVKQYATTLPAEQRLLYGQMEKISSRWHEFVFLVIAAFLFVLFVTVTDAKRLISQIVTPIKSLTSHAQYLSGGDYAKADLLCGQTFSFSELQTLCDAFLHMSRTIQNQIRQLNEKMVLSQKLHQLQVENMTTQVMLSKTEICLMQSLINPHFLFNCLSLLSGLAVMEKAPKVREYAMQIAQFLRESLSYVGRHVCVREEFSHIQRYIEIQKLRFGKRITFTTDCPQECQSAVIPAIILQPLVENSLVHGVGSYLKEGEITVLARQKDNRIFLSVTDNGVGMSEECLKELYAKLDAPFEAGKKGTGLPSVLYRLRYFFQDDVQLTLQSDRQRTEVCVSIPFQTAFPDDDHSLNPHISL